MSSVAVTWRLQPWPQWTARPRRCVAFGVAEVGVVGELAGDFGADRLGLGHGGGCRPVGVVGERVAIAVRIAPRLTPCSRARAAILAPLRKAGVPGRWRRGGGAGRRCCRWPGLRRGRRE